VEGWGKTHHSRNALRKRSNAGGVDPVAQTVNGGYTENAFFGINDQAMLAKTSKDVAEMLSVFHLVPAGHFQIVLEGKQKNSWFLTQSVFLWKVLLVLRRPKGILVYSNNPKGVVIAVLLMSSGRMISGGIPSSGQSC
jgi:hypothetical protein